MVLAMIISRCAGSSGASFTNSDAGPASPLAYVTPMRIRWLVATA
jgi:hypothetical protein